MHLFKFTSHITGLNYLHKCTNQTKRNKNKTSSYLNQTLGGDNPLSICKNFPCWVVRKFPSGVIGKYFCDIIISWMLNWKPLDLIIPYQYVDISPAELLANFLQERLGNTFAILYFHECWVGNPHTSFITIEMPDDCHVYMSHFYEQLSFHLTTRLVFLHSVFAATTPFRAH